MGGGSLQVTGVSASEIIGISNTNGITYSAVAIEHNGSLIGTVDVLSGTGSGEQLSVTLEATVTTISVEALIKSLTYGNEDDLGSGTNGSNNLTLTITDGAGASASTSIGISITAENESAATITTSRFTGTINADIIEGTAGDDTLIGNGGSDELRGGLGNDLLQVADATFELLRGGDGQDTLYLQGNLDLDLSGIDNLKIRSIETIDLNDTDTANDLTLSLQDVFDISDTSNASFATATSSQNLAVKGTTGDTVTLENGAGGTWVQDPGTTDISGVTHNTYNYVHTASTNVLASVAIETDVSVTTG